MSTAISINTPQFFIRGLKGEHFDIFSDRHSAIQAAINLGVEYYGTTFLVIKKIANKEKVIFKFNINIEHDFDDLKDVNRHMVHVYEEKLAKTRFWRTND